VLALVDEVIGSGVAPEVKQANDIACLRINPGQIGGPF
jgi:hypothetical protein